MELALETLHLFIIIICKFLHKVYFNKIVYITNMEYVY